MQTELEIRRFRTSTRLGVSEAERARPQDVEFSLICRFATPPPGCVSDRIDDTRCYADMCRVMQEIAGAHGYALLEKLAADVYAALQKFLGPDCRLDLSVHKLHPPIEGLQDGVIFRIQA